MWVPGAPRVASGITGKTPDATARRQIETIAFSCSEKPPQPSKVLFRNRHHAGTLLAERLEELRSESPVILGLPRGGVVVAEPVARSLAAPLDVIIVRKLGVPFQPELAMGAIGEGDVRVIEESVMAATRLDARQIEQVELREKAVLDARIEQYRQWRPAVPLSDRTTVIVDDGIATGATVRAACQVVASRGAAKSDCGRARCHPGGDQKDPPGERSSHLPPDASEVWGHRPVL